MLPFATASAQRDGRSENDSTERRTSAAQAGIGFAGFGAGFLSLFSADGPSAAPQAAYCGGACARLRRSSVATTVLNRGSAFELVFDDDMAEPGSSRAGGALQLSSNSGDARSSSASGGNGGAKKGEAGWRPLSTPAADAPGILKKLEAGASFDVPDLTPMCGSLVCAPPPVVWVPEAAAVAGGLGDPGSSLSVLNDLSVVNGTIVNPEPGTIVLTVMGLGALAIARRRTRVRS